MLQVIASPVGRVLPLLRKYKRRPPGSNIETIKSALPRPPAVILSAAKDLRPGRVQILRCAQDDSRAEVHAYGVPLLPLPAGNAGGDGHTVGRLSVIHFPPASLCHGL